jgi:hypothetical protein
MEAKRSSEELVLRHGESGKREPVGVWHREDSGSDRVCGQKEQRDLCCRRSKEPGRRRSAWERGGGGVGGGERAEAMLAVQ